MQGIKITEEDSVLSFLSAKDGDMLATASEAGDGLLGAEFGKAKMTELSEIPLKGRATQGVRVQRFTKDDKRLYFAAVCEKGEICTGKTLERIESSKRDSAGQSLSGRAIGAH